MLKTFLIILVLLFIGCENLLEPELNYIFIKYHESEIVGGTSIYYCSKHTGTHLNRASVDMWGSCRIVSYATEGEDFSLSDYTFHCKTVTRDYIEVAKK